MTTSAVARRSWLLDRMGAEALEQLVPHLSEVDLRAGQLLHDAGEPLTTVWFPLDGVISLVVELDDGNAVEAASVGFEGMVGLSVYLGGPAPTESACVQVPGKALTMPADHFAQAVRVLDGPLETSLRRYAKDVFTQLARNAACNRVHSVRQRAARRLLMTADRVDGPSFELTQHSLAQMLAVRRASVSEVARDLSENGCITYTRGTITVLDRDQLESTACSCYTRLLKAHATL